MYDKNLGNNRFTNAIKQHKELLIKQNNAKENTKQIPYQYHIGDKILVKCGWQAKYADSPYEGPYKVTRVGTNGTLRYSTGVVDDVIKIRNVTPYNES